MLHNFNRIAYKPRKPEETDAQYLELAGPVKQIMHVSYKANGKEGAVVRGKIESGYSSLENNFIVSFDETGRIMSEELFGKEGKHFKTYNSKGLIVKTVQHIHGKLYDTTTYTYNELDKQTEYLSTYADGHTYRITHTFTEDGRPLLDETYSTRNNEVTLLNKAVYTYDERKNLLSIIRYDEKGDIDHQSHNIYNEQNKRIESRTQYTDKSKWKHNHWTKHKYNQHGDCIETTYLNDDGTVRDVYAHNYEYDSEGKKIIKKNPPPVIAEKVKGETEIVENDSHGNWIKKTTFYNKIPVNIFEREFIYYDDAEETKNKSFTHPITNSPVEEMKDEKPELEELTNEQAQWLAEVPNYSADNFPVARYYAMMFKESPSLVNYTGPHIEALSLLEMLKDDLNAQEIHSYCTVWDQHGEQMLRYTVKFPQNEGYLLSAIAISGHDADEYEVPETVDDSDGNVYTSTFHLLRPSDASDKRDEYFEEQLDKCFSLCSLSKKPDKPVINMIEVKGSNFGMVEHAVDDNFEIKDLDVNYGYGFSKFHSDLMHRFNTSTKGLVLFHGQPGTGKTYYIRHLLRSMVANKKVVIYMPPNMVDHLVEPAFMTFLSEEVREWSNDGNFCVLLIEDAEPLLAKRQEGVRIQGITNLLNMTDGLLNDMLNLQIICTFNVDLRRLDSALLRPGRLIARKEFKALSELDANLLAQRLGIKHHFKSPATLGEIYALRKNKNTLIHDVEQDKGASTNIDDLL